MRRALRGAVAHLSGAPTGRRALIASSHTASLRASNCAAGTAAAVRRARTPLLFSLSASFVQARFQRSVSNRPRSSSWRERVQRYDEQKEEQRRDSGSSPRGASAHRRRRTWRTEGAGGAMIFDFFSGERPLEEEEEGERKPLTSNNRRWVPGAEYDAHHDRANSNPTAVPRYGFLRSIGLWGRRKVKSMPMNPLHDVQTTSSMRRRYASDPDAAHLSRFLLAIEELYGKSRRRGEEVAVQFSEEEKRGIVARYAETRWWGRLYNPVKDVSDSQIRRTLRWGRFVIALCVSAIFGALLLMYRQEMHMVSELSAQDRRDYTRMVMGMRQGDIRKLGNEVLSKEDPLYVLPEAARCHILLEEARKRHWDKVDWEVECRNQHPESALVEGDFIHLLYWAAMLVGNLLYGGSAVFDDAAFRFADASKDKERREPAKPLGPTAKPESVKRTFFS